jgi:hypothetical protein
VVGTSEGTPVGDAVGTAGIEVDEDVNIQFIYQKDYSGKKRNRGDTRLRCTGGRRDYASTACL